MTMPHALDMHGYMECCIEKKMVVFFYHGCYLVSLYLGGPKILTCIKNESQHHTFLHSFTNHVPPYMCTQSE
jgi:hypothetical protein